jgi:hypothetical protein
MAPRIFSLVPPASGLADRKLSKLQDTCRSCLLYPPDAGNSLVIDEPDQQKRKHRNLENHLGAGFGRRI